MRVTFDSNVWEKIVRPERAKKNTPSFRAALPRVRQALVDGRISGFIAESYFTIEAMTKAQRSEFLASQTLIAQRIQAVLPDGTETTMIMAAGDESRRPGLPREVVEPMQDALAIGLRVMAHPRFHTLGLPASWFVGEDSDAEARTRVASAEIEAKGVGRSRLRAYAHKLSWQYDSHEPFFDVPNVPMTKQEATKVSKLAAEWADGEAVACHIGYANDVICSEDRAERALKPSIFDVKHRAWLTASYGTRFMKLEELEQTITS